MRNSAESTLHLHASPTWRLDRSGGCTEIVNDLAGIRLTYDDNAGFDPANQPQRAKAISFILKALNCHDDMVQGGQRVREWMANYPVEFHGDDPLPIIRQFATALARAEM